MDAAHLYRLALESLEEGEYERAADLAQRLIEQGLSGGFEILARTHFEQDELEQAIEVLRRGLKHSPRAWVLWVQMGNYLSDAESFEEASSAYARARLCPGSDLTQVDLNEAILHRRMGDPKFALELVRRVLTREKQGEFYQQARRDEVGVLAALGLFEESESLISLQKFETWEQADLYTELAEELLKAGRNQEALLKAQHAISLRRTGHAYNVVRRVQGDRSPIAKAYHAVLRGVLEEPDEDGEPLHFFTTYDVVADNEGEVLTICRAAEQTRLGGDLSLEEAEIEQSLPGEAKGVVWVGGYIFFEDED